MVGLTRGVIAFFHFFGQKVKTRDKAINYIGQWSTIMSASSFGKLYL